MADCCGNVANGVWVTKQKGEAMRTKITAEEWEDSQKGEARFWAGQVANGNTEQRNRDGWYRDVCFPAVFGAYNFKGKYLIDLGSGPEGILCSIPEAGCRVQVDPLFGEFERQGFKHPQRVACMTAACESVPLPAGRFDVVFCMNMLDHCQDPAAVVKEAAQLMRHDGMFILCVDMRPPELIDRMHKLRLTAPVILEWMEAAGLTCGWRPVPHQTGNAAVQFCGVACKAKS